LRFLHFPTSGSLTLLTLQSHVFYRVRLPLTLALCEHGLSPLTHASRFTSCRTHTYPPPHALRARSRTFSPHHYGRCLLLPHSTTRYLFVVHTYHTFIWILFWIIVFITLTLFFFFFAFAHTARASRTAPDYTRTLTPSRFHSCAVCDITQRWHFAHAPEPRPRVYCATPTGRGLLYDQRCLRRRSRLTCGHSSSIFLRSLQQLPLCRQQHFT